MKCLIYEKRSVVLFAEPRIANDKVERILGDEVKVRGNDDRIVFVLEVMVSTKEKQ